MTLYFSSDTPYKGSGVMDLAIVSLHSWLASCAAISPGIANPRPTARPAVSGNIVTLHSWPPQPNDRPGRRPIVTLHSWQPGRLTPTHILLAGLTAQALAGQSRLYRI